MPVSLRRLLYPDAGCCLWCASPRAGAACASCAAQLMPPAGARCVRCLRRLAAAGEGDLRSPRRCPSCRVRPPGYHAVSALGPYRGLLRWTIHALKTRRERYLAPALADMLTRTLLDDGAVFDVVVAVPGDPRRNMRRGFHPAELLADHLAARWRRPLLPGALRRARRTPPQSTLRGTARRRNLRDALGVPARAEALLAGRRVLLVDDVATTGSTLDVAARCLLRAGASLVWAVVLADNASGQDSL